MDNNSLKYHNYKYGLMLYIYFSIPYIYNYIIAYCILIINICVFFSASIGFTAWASSVVRYSSGTTLIFNGMDEHVEEPVGYDRGTGLFTCPITGIYYVYVALRKNNNNNIYVDVFKMKNRIIRFLKITQTHGIL